MLNLSKNNLENYSEHESDVYHLFSEFSMRNGFEFFTILKSPNESDTKLSEVTLLSNWPAYLAWQYDRLELIKSSTAMFNFNNNRDTQFSKIDSFLGGKTDTENSYILELFQRSGLRYGTGLQFETQWGERGAAFFIAKSKPVYPHNLEILRSYACKVFEKLISKEQYRLQKCPKLSRREHECLLWTSQGKTSFEIGIILGLSENTINNYLVATGRKLGAVNRPHMVGIALRKNLI